MSTSVEACRQESSNLKRTLFHRPQPIQELRLIRVDNLFVFNDFFVFVLFSSPVRRIGGCRRLSCRDESVGLWHLQRRRRDHRLQLAALGWIVRAARPQVEVVLQCHNLQLSRIQMDCVGCFITKCVIFHNGCQVVGTGS